MARQSLAEKYRQHRREFVLAQELGCTPIEARFALRRRDKGAVGTPKVETAAPQRLRDLPDEPWMMRD
ncbi:hypothetical protein AAJ72_09060 [Citromicrobium sp. RCC1885]|uniref:hypothetical protein n=1 Tax=unclassified Citromicrobium TaxID=2630544 RepID=UPI0006C931CA|nr:MULTISPECIES: hypothetical protein [unclassified Citromicrobium]KPM23057.1 hypothetical protein AAJ72_09060 [Citromicrobium sp. RCC1885]KPM27199.1 hypothetical protein AAJ74_09800 [Citromicrobium sp. RCC1878]OAM09025.1 hypothetical protein A0U43_10500 [Citromicrobium sp. RCC1897]|tara:strand:+ start:2534 stop:2737 length:204 start_codon:yes stop_codon:yes gene_type:complete